MLSIGMLTYSTKPRGSVVHAASLAEALARAGHDVTLYALAKDGAGFFRPLACAVALIAAGEAPPEKAALIRQRVAEFANGLRLRKASHDVFHAQDCLAASALFEEDEQVRRPIARTVHHVDAFDDPYLRACQRRSVLDADLVFGVSRMTQDDVELYFGRRPVLVHNGVDLARFAAPTSVATAAIRRKYGIAADDTLILSVGGVEPRKNSRRALAAVARLYENHPRIAWLIVGGESIWDHAAYQAEFEADRAMLASGLAARIVRVGAIADDDLTCLYRASDILLCPSTQEGFGLAVLESMAAGTPVVVSGREPFTEYLNEEAAAFVNPDSVESIARALVDLAADPGRRARIAKVASKVAKDFSWDTSAAAHVPHYEAAIRARGRRRENCSHA